MLFLLSSRYRWPMGKTKAGKTVYQKDFVHIGLGILFVANIFVAIAVYEHQQAGDLGAWIILANPYSIFFVMAGFALLFFRRRLIFDPVGRTVRHTNRGLLGKSEKQYSYDQVKAEIVRPGARLALRITMEGFHADIARAAKRSDIDEIAEEFTRDTGLEVKAKAESEPE